MTGPWHFHQAEYLLNQITVPSKNAPGQRILAADVDMDVIAVAQVHATLALAAATALNDAEGGLGYKDQEEWRTACSLSKPFPEAAS